MITRTEALTALKRIDGMYFAVAEDAKIIQAFLESLPAEKITCPRCKGKGTHRIPSRAMVRCLTCHGVGTVTE